MTRSFLTVSLTAIILSANAASAGSTPGGSENRAGGTILSAPNSGGTAGQCACYLKYKLGR